MPKKMLKAAIMGVVVGTVAGFLFHPEKGKRNRDKVKKVSKDVIKRVRQEVDGLGDVTKRHYDKIVTKVVADFKEDKTLSKEAWDEVGEELKARWSDISREVKASVKKKPAAKKPAAKKTTRKTTKKK
jgi:gas vesicle protein